MALKIIATAYRWRYQFLLCLGIISTPDITSQFLDGWIERVETMSVRKVKMVAIVHNCSSKQLHYHQPMDDYRIEP